jgi:GT2 family glycosyltransferase
MLSALNELNGHTPLLVSLVDTSRDNATRERIESMIFDYPMKYTRAGSQNFWASAMRIAWEEAAVRGSSDVLWLNDDVVLDVQVMKEYLDYARQRSTQISVGATSDDTGALATYSALRRQSSMNPLKLVRVEPHDPKIYNDSIVTFNGNCVYVPSAVSEKLGGLAHYTHGLADLDYGFRATQRSVPIKLYHRYIGQCPRNPIWDERSLSLQGRLEASLRLCSKRALPPVEYLRYCRAHAPVSWPIAFLAPWLGIWRPVTTRGQS